MLMSGVSQRINFLTFARLTTSSVKYNHIPNLHSLKRSQALDKFIKGVSCSFSASLNCILTEVLIIFSLEAEQSLIIFPQVVGISYTCEEAIYILLQE